MNDKGKLEMEASANAHEVDRLKSKFYEILDRDSFSEKDELELRTNVFALKSIKSANEKLIEEILSSGVEVSALMELFASLDFVNDLSKYYDGYANGTITLDIFINSMIPWRPDDTPGGPIEDIHDSKSKPLQDMHEIKELSKEIDEEQVHLILNNSTFEHIKSKIQIHFTSNENEKAGKCISQVLKGNSTIELKLKVINQLFQELEINNEIALAFQNSPLLSILTSELSSNNNPFIYSTLKLATICIPFQIDSRTKVEAEESLSLPISEMEIKVNKLSSFFELMEETMRMNSFIDSPISISKKQFNSISLSLLQVCENWCESFSQLTQLIFENQNHDPTECQKSIDFLENSYWHHETVKILLNDDDHIGKAIGFKLDSDFLTELILKQHEFSDRKAFQIHFTEFAVQRKVQKLSNELKKKFEIKIKMPQINLESSISIKNEIDFQAFYLVVSDYLNSDQLLQIALGVFEKKTQDFPNGRICKLAQSALQSISDFIKREEIEKKTLNSFKQLLSSSLSMQISQGTIEKVNNALLKLSQNSQIVSQNRNEVKSIEISGRNDSRDFQTIPKKTNSPLMSNNESFQSFLNDKVNSRFEDISQNSNGVKKSFKTIFENSSNEKLIPKKYQKPQFIQSNKQIPIRSKLTTDKNSILKQENRILKKKLEDSMKRLETEKKLNFELNKLLGNNFLLYFLMLINGIENESFSSVVSKLRLQF